jgi:hypothetical protein
VYQVPSGVSVSRATMCLMTPPRPGGWENASSEIGTPGQREGGAGSVNPTILPTSRTGRALRHYVPESTDFRVRF